jgi:hypothetical protein
VRESEDYAKQLLASFIAARLKAKQADAGTADPKSPGPEQVTKPQPDRSGPSTPFDQIRRHNEAVLPGRAHYPIFGLGSSN